MINNDKWRLSYEGVSLADFATMDERLKLEDE